MIPWLDLKSLSHKNQTSKINLKKSHGSFTKNLIESLERRTLYDASNSQTYLNDTSDLSTASTQKTGKTSQILTNRSAPNESQQNSEDNLPPSKKLKSLMQSLFDSSMDINQSDENREIKKVTNTSIYVEDTDSEDD